MKPNHISAIAVTAVAFAFGFFSTATSTAQGTFAYQAFLSGANESPVNASPGTGFASVVVNPTQNSLQVVLSFSGLLGTTTASHIHAATAVAGAGTAGVATTTPTFANFPLGVTSGSYSNLLDLTAASSYNPAYISANGGTTASAEAALLASIAAGTAYLNIHTTTVPGGEIRGFLTPVPEPGALALLSLGGGLCYFAVRRRA